MFLFSLIQLIYLIESMKNPNATKHRLKIFVEKLFLEICQLDMYWILCTFYCYFACLRFQLKQKRFQEIITLTPTALSLEDSTRTWSPAVHKVPTRNAESIKMTMHNSIKYLYIVDLFVEAVKQGEWEASSISYNILAL